MTDTTQDNGIVVAPSLPLGTQARSQLRIAIAAFGGALVLRHVLPAWMVNDQTIDYVTGLAILGISVVWQRLHDKLVHAKFFDIAANPEVPDSVAKVG